MSGVKPLEQERYEFASNTLVFGLPNAIVILTIMIRMPSYCHIMSSNKKHHEEINEQTA